MMTQLFFLLPSFLVSLLPLFTPVDGGHVLVFPGEYSHWLNMRSIMEELVRRNHSVTVLVCDASPSINYNDPHDATKFNFVVFKVTSTLVFKDLQRLSMCCHGDLMV